MTSTMRGAALAALLCLLTPTGARADFLVAPFLAITRNKDSGRWVNGGGFTAELASGWLLAGADLGYAAGFFDPEEDALDLIASSHVLTISGHAGVGLPAADSDARYFPYVTAGFGWMRQQARDREGLVSASRADPAVNVGGGVRVMFNRFLGVRGDLRYFRSLRDPYETPDPIVADLERLGFWRVALAGVIRFGD